MKLLSVLLFILFSVNANAIAVSSLFEAADPDTHSAEIVIENNDGKDMFINLEMAKVEYVDGKKVVTKLSKDNLQDWTFSISPSQLVLSPGEKKTIRMINKCLPDKCEYNSDQVYAVDITPVPYSEGKVSSVAVAFGYRVYFMDPAKKPNLNYSIKRLNDNKFKFSNHSNTMLNAVLNVCSKEFSSDCIYQYKLLSGATKEFKLPEKVRNKAHIKFNVINANEEVNEEVSI
ncbi:pilus assembly protein [Vibrio rumoiensis]|uniref:Pilus assembly protein n=1 Tax=Vibrio rumoiensis TaxID=76258 RepID=A0ABW7IZX0_9VIBR